MSLTVNVQSKCYQFSFCDNADKVFHSQMKESVQPEICHNVTYNLQHTIPAVFDVGVVVSCTGLTAVHNDTNKFVDGSFVP